MPRAAPVTSATLPASGRFQSAGTPDGAPTAITWPETYAERPESRNRSVDAMPSSAPGATRTSCAVAPPRTSFASDRTKPSSARCPRPASTIARPLGASAATTGEKNANSSRSSALAPIPEASKTSAPNRSVRSAPAAPAGPAPAGPAPAGPAPAGPAPRRPPRPRVDAGLAQHARGRLGEAAAARGAEQRGAVQQRRARLETAQRAGSGRPRRRMTSRPGPVATMR